jgi:hypothetical protein
VFIDENRRMKTIVIVLRMGKGGKRENDGRVNPTKIHCKHICKYHNVSPMQLLYTRKLYLILLIFLCCLIKAFFSYYSAFVINSLFLDGV